MNDFTLLLLVWLGVFAILVAWVMWCFTANNMSEPEGNAPDDIEHDPPDIDEDDEEDDCSPVDLLRMPQEDLP